MLLELAIGDAYGAGFEFAAPEKIRDLNDLAGYQSHELGLPAGSYTDDTQMTLALCELMLGDSPWTPLAIADKFVSVFKRDPRLGYAAGFQALLESLDSGQEFLARIHGGSQRNGAAMRAIPCGLFANEAEVIAKATLQARLTHDSDKGIRAAVAIALAAHYLWKQRGPVSGLREYLLLHQGQEWSFAWSGPVPCAGDATVNAVFSTLSGSRSLQDLLWQAVAWGGDVDSVAALTLGLAALSGEYRRDLPARLYQDLENGGFGRDYLSKVGSALLAKFPR